MPNPIFGPGNKLDTFEDAMILDEQQPSNNPMQTLGSTGLKRVSGIIDEEFLPALRGRKAVKVFQEMSLNDPTIGSLLFSITQLLRQIDWRVEAPDNTPDATAAKDFIEQCMEDMSHTWDDMIADILTSLVYGWSWHEIVYKKRVGPWEKDPAKRSKYTDGKIGWRKIPIRSQETLLRWVFDDDGGVKAMVQMAPPYYRTVVLPIERSLLFRTNSAKGNPEGVSMLRNAYRPWFYKKRLEEFEAIGVERDLAGMPVAHVPASYMDAPVNSRERKVFDAFKRMVSNVRRDEHEGLVLPMQYDRNTKQPLFSFELMSSGGSRTFDTNALIQRYEQRILMTVLADFIMVGHEGSGSYSLHVDKTGIFRSALNSIAQMVADTFNRYAIPRLFELNGWRPDELPQIVPANVDPPDLTQLAQFMNAMGSLGMEWFPDADLEEYLRQVARLPKMPDEKLELRRKMSEQFGEMAYAEQSMQYLGLQQMTGKVGQGYSPEQAAMDQQNPNDEQVQAQTGQQMFQQGAQMEAQMAQQMDPRVQEQQNAQAQQQQAGAEQDAERQSRMRVLEDDTKERDHQRRLELMQEQEKSKDRDFQRTREQGSEDDRLKEREAQRRLRLARDKGKDKKDER